MSEKQKNSLKKKYFTTSMSDPLRHGVTGEELGTKKCLSITVENAHVIDIPFPVLGGMFNKVATTVDDRSALWRVPSDEGSDRSAPVRVMVYSRSSRDPHSVQVYLKTGKVQCDKGCANWATYSMCSHTLAAAEKMGVLKEFLNWFKGKKRSPNPSAIANVNMPKNAGQKVGTRKRKGGSNKTLIEGRQVVRSRVLQPALEPLSNTVSSNPTVPGTSNQSKERRPLVCNQVWQPSFASVSNAVPSCPPVPGTFVSDQNVTFSPLNAPYAPIQPSHGFNVPESSSSYIIYNYPCQQHERQQVKENTPPTYPQRPNPTPGILVFARLAFLDSKVTRCYGCGYSLKPDRSIPDPPDDLVLTTRLHRQYYKAGQQQTSPDISTVYYHVNPFCIRVTFSSFEPNVCRIPADLQPFLLQEHKQMIVQRLAVRF